MLFVKLAVFLVLSSCTQTSLSHKERADHGSAKLTARSGSRCSPGTYSSNGNSPCTKCAAGTYSKGGRSCPVFQEQPLISCPSHRVWPEQMPTSKSRILRFSVRSKHRDSLLPGHLQQQSWVDGLLELSSGFHVSQQLYAHPPTVLSGSLLQRRREGLSEMSSRSFQQHPHGD